MTEDHTPPFIGDWLGALQPQSLNDLVVDPAATAIFSADMINGFLHFGSLASPRVRALAEPVASLCQRAWDLGVRQFVLLQDSHHPDTPEFETYPSHCEEDSDESHTIPELASLPFANIFTVIEKNSLNPAIATGFDHWLDTNRQVATAIVVGDCTDLCTHQLAMHLRMRANALNIKDFTVTVPANAVDTFDIPLDPESPATSAHPGDFFHNVFLYHMAQNGIRVVTELT